MRFTVKRGAGNQQTAGLQQGGMVGGLKHHVMKVYGLWIPLQPSKVFLAESAMRGAGRARFRDRIKPGAWGSDPRVRHSGSRYIAAPCLVLKGVLEQLLQVLD